MTVAVTGVQSAFAATYTVTSCADTGPGSLREAISAANSNPGADNVNFNLTCSTITLLSTIDIGEDIVIQGPGSAGLTITSSANRIFSLLPEAAPPAFQQIAISGIRFANSSNEGGGAIDAQRSNLSLQETVFANNDAEGGGAITFSSTVAAPRSLVIENSTFVGNGRSVITAGGAVAAGNALVTIRHSLFRENGAMAGGGAGGAIAVSGGALLVQDSAFYSNRGDSGGAIAVVAIYAPTIVRILNTAFAGNLATGTQSDGFGGGAIFGSQADLQIENTTFSANVVRGSATGAAIDFRGGALSLTNNTVAGNRVESISNQNASVTAFPVPAAGGIVEIPVSVIARNTVATATVAADSGKAADLWVARSLVGSGATLDTQFSFISSLRTPTGSSLTPGNASLSSAADHGGTRPGASGATDATMTLIPLPGSPLINAGSTIAATQSTDQRGAGFPRVIGSAIDIGAVEYTPNGAPPTSDAPPANVPTLSPQNIAMLAIAVLFAGWVTRRRSV